MMMDMKEDIAITRELAARQVDGYLRRRASASEAGARAVESPHATITISYMTGVPGTRIGEQVAAELGFHVFDREVLEAVERDTHLGNSIMEALDEGKRSALDAWIQGWINLDRRIVDPQSFHHMVSRIIRGIWLHGHAIILGRGSNFVLRGTDAFRVRLTAEPELRARALAAEEGRDQEWALREVSHQDRQKRKFIHEYFKADLDDPTAYDASFNLRSLETEPAARLILAAYRVMAGRQERPEGPPAPA